MAVRHIRRIRVLQLIHPVPLVNGGIMQQILVKQLLLRTVHRAGIGMGILV